MKFQIVTTFDDEFYKGGEEYNEIISNLKNAKLDIIEEPDWDNTNWVYIYTEINSIEELNRLVEEFNCPVVYGEKTIGEIIIIEIYRNIKN